MVYFADSTRLKPESFWDRPGLRSELEKKAWRALGRELPILEYRVGYRPVVKGHDFGYLLKVPGAEVPTWVINGGGKNGLIAYALRASELLQELESR